MCRDDPRTSPLVSACIKPETSPILIDFPMVLFGSFASVQRSPCWVSSCPECGRTNKGPSLRLSATTGLMHCGKHQAGPSPQSVSGTCLSSSFLTFSTESIAAPSWVRNCSIDSFIGGGRYNATHRFFDGSQHFLYGNFTVGSRHSAVASSSADKLLSMAGPSHYRNSVSI
jgi:hypothetical protein